MIDLKKYGYKESNPIPEGLIPGRVIEFRRDKYLVMTELGEVLSALKGSFLYEAEIRADLPCVGDFVLLEYNASGDSRIFELLPRFSKFSRSDSFGHGFAHIKANHEQIVAVNFDYVFIVTSLNRDFRLNRILRYLTQAKNSGGQPVIILTKADLTDDFSPQIEEIRAAAPMSPCTLYLAIQGLGLMSLVHIFSPKKPSYASACQAWVSQAC